MKVYQSLDDLAVTPEDPGSNQVLIVDDDLTQRMILMRLLRKASYESAAAMSNQEARSLLEKSTYGLVITDLHMFAEDGIELVRHIAEAHPSTYSIVVSGFIPENDVDRLRRAGAFDIMAKPIHADVLLEKVEAAFAHRAENLALRRHKAG